MADPRLIGKSTESTQGTSPRRARAPVNPRPMHVPRWGPKTKPTAHPWYLPASPTEDGQGEAAEIGYLMGVADPNTAHGWRAIGQGCRY